jgi:hypothetical protein
MHRGTKCILIDVTPHPAWLGTQRVEPEQVHYLPGNLVNVGYTFKRYPDGSEALLYSGPTNVGKCVKTAAASISWTC